MSFFPTKSLICENASKTQRQKKQQLSLVVEMQTLYVLLMLFGCYEQETRPSQLLLYPFFF